MMNEKNSSCQDKCLLFRPPTIPGVYKQNGTQTLPTSQSVIVNVIITVTKTDAQTARGISLIYYITIATMHLKHSDLT